MVTGGINIIILRNSRDWGERILFEPKTPLLISYQEDVGCYWL